MAVLCTDCGCTVDDLVAHRTACGGPTLAASQAVDEDAWFLHVLGGKRFGPLTIEEIRTYFTSGMVRAQDRVAGPGTDGPTSAAEVAALLQVRVPVEALPPAPPAAPMTQMALPSPGTTPHAMGWRGALLWMAGLFAVQMYVMPVGALGVNHSLRTFVAAISLRYLGIALACALVAVLINKLLRGKGAPVKDALLAMTLVYVVLLGNRFLRPPPAGPAATQELAVQAPTGERISVVRALTDERSGAALPAPVSANPVAAPAKRDWFGQGQAMGQRGDWASLLKHATEWTIAEPDEPAAWAMQGFAYDELQQPHQAVKVYRHALDLDPTSHVTWDNLGGVYEDLGRYQDAVNAHNQALRIAPSFASAWNNLGIVHVHTGQTAAAIEAFKKAVELDPNFVKAWNNLGLLYLRVDRPAEAAATYRTALAIEPGNSQAAKGLSNAINQERRVAR